MRGFSIMMVLAGLPACHLVFSHSPAEPSAPPQAEAGKKRDAGAEARALDAFGDVGVDASDWRADARIDSRRDSELPDKKPTGLEGPIVKSDLQPICATPLPTAQCLGGWCKIPAGCFQMGSPAGELCRQADETRHEVTITKNFEVMEKEVTQAEYVAKVGTPVPGFNNPGATNPAENISQTEASAYCAQVGGRLPTEAEWEYAYRAGAITATYGGDLQVCSSDPVADGIGWYAGNSGNQTHVVGTHGANKWGLYDMAGNVREWVSDYYGPLSAAPAKNPTGATVGSWRVLRGGSYKSPAGDLRAARRDSNSSGALKFPDVGFRCVR